MIVEKINVISFGSVHAYLMYVAGYHELSSPCVWLAEQAISAGWSQIMLPRQQQGNLPVPVLFSLVYPGSIF